MNKLELLKNKIKYRSTYRGTKEMDILLSNFVDKYIDIFNEDLLKELEKFLDFEDEIILNYYHYNIALKGIDHNEISELFKNFKI